MAFWGKKDDNEKNKKQPATPFALDAAPKDTPVSPTPIAKSEPLPESPRNDPYGKVRSALGPGTIIQGKLSFDTIVSIDGKLGGEIFSSKALLVGKSGIVDATIDVQVLVVKGVVRGTIRASERIELREGGQIFGEVITPILVMDEGCQFNGTCTMGEAIKASSSKLHTESKKDHKDAHTLSTPKSSVDAEQISVI